MEGIIREPFLSLSSAKTKIISFLAMDTLLVFIILSGNTHICSSLDDDERWPPYCSSFAENEWWPTPYCNTTTATNNSTFLRNVNTTFNSLHVDLTNISQHRFNTYVYGQSPNQIYALLQCRGDATVHECNNCSQHAKICVLQICGNHIGGKLWSKFCFLRYNANYNFIGHLDIYGYNLPNPNVSSDPAAYAQAARQLLSNLSSEITSGSAKNRYASGTTVDSAQFRDIYGLAQCWGDISLTDCKTCLSTKIDFLFKPNIAGRLGARGMAGSCVVQYEGFLFFNPSPSPTPLPHVASAPPPEKSPRKIPIILGVLGGLLLMLIVFLFGTRRILKSAIFGRTREGVRHMGNEPQIREGEQPANSGQVTMFKMETLIAATENFHDNNKLGEGGFGAVYKGTTPEGNEIAVKKLSLESMQGKKEFLNEVKLVAKVQHRNLVKLLGCCAEGTERLLVYEYLPNNSLDKILFVPNKRRQLDWQKRYSIILGVTRGLLYLHEDSHLRIIHRDIKASNILLDKNLNPKIADFGLARLFEEDETYVGTKVAGTRGYMAPEYAMHGHLSVKADVYSFGILLLELISGRKNVDFKLSAETQILVEWAWGLYKRGNIEDMIDPVINETCSDQEQALRCIHVGLLCTQAAATLRPSMSTVNLMLSTEAMMLRPDPTKPAFVSSVATHESNPGSSHPSAAISSSVSSASWHAPLVPPSNATASVSELEPR